MHYYGIITTHGICNSPRMHRVIQISVRFAFCEKYNFLHKNLHHKSNKDHKATTSSKIIYFQLKPINHITRKYKYYILLFSQLRSPFILQRQTNGKYSKISIPQIILVELTLNNHSKLWLEGFFLTILSGDFQRRTSLKWPLLASWDCSSTIQMIACVLCVEVKESFNRLLKYNFRFIKRKKKTKQNKTKKLKLHEIVTPLLKFNLITYFQLLVITTTKQQIVYFTAGRAMNLIRNKRISRIWKIWRLWY